MTEFDAFAAQHQTNTHIAPGLDGRANHTSGGGGGGLGVALPTVKV
jgi:hypothetical protein